MRTYTPAITVLVILAVLLGAGFMTAGLFESPQTRFHKQVDEKVEQAQRMLQQYEGGQPVLLAALQRLSTLKAEPGTQPAAEPARAPAGDEAVAGDALPGRRDLVAEQQDQLDGQRRELSARLAGMGGEELKPGAEFESPEELQARVEANAALLSKALDTVREVIGFSEGELSGNAHPVATRLEAVLIQHQADLERRQAAVHRARSDAEHNAFDEVMASWRIADNRVKTLETTLAGIAGGTISPDAPGPAPTAIEPAGGIPATRPAAGPADARPAGKGVLGALRGLLGKKSATDSTEPAVETPAPSPSDNASPDIAATSAPAEVAGPALPLEIGAVPAIDERIGQLEALGRQTDDQIADAQAEVTRLSTSISGLEARLNKARSEADASERRMMELEDGGIDPTDPAAMKRFKEQYDLAAKANRDATREATALENGMLRNARPDAQEENEILSARLVPARPGVEIKAEPGLTALQADRRAAQAYVETRQQLRKQIDAEVQALVSRRDQTKGDLTKAQAWRDGLVKAATARAQAAMAEAIQAEQIENQAIDRLANEGQAAAGRAAEAARSRNTQISEFYQKQAAGSPQTQFLAGHAQAVAGDLELERALILAQQANGLQRHASMLAALTQLGVDPAGLAPAKATGEPGAGEIASPPPGTPATQPQGIAQAAEAARSKALEAAKAALERYTQASESLNRLWMLHTQIGAVHYLMASLTTGDESQKHREAGRKEYEQAIRDRRDRPEGRAYQPMVDTLAPQPQ